MATPHAVPIHLSTEDYVFFEERLQAPTTPQRDVFRCRIILLASQGWTNQQIAASLGCRHDTVRTWRKRFARHGRSGLLDRPRPGRPRAFSPSAVGCHPCPAL